MNRRKLFIEILISVFVLLIATCSVFADVIPSDRIIDWSRNGVIQPDGTKGIPVRTGTPCATLDAATYGNGSTDATAALQAAVDSPACKQPDRFLYIPAGTYKLAGAVTIDHPLVIRGAGTKATLIVEGANIIFSRSPGSGWLGGLPYPTYAVNWTSGFNKGDTVITLADTSNLHVGQEILLDQLNDTHVSLPGYIPIVNETGNEGANGIAGNNGASRDGLSFETDGTHECPRGLQQLVQIKSISGQTVTIDTPLYYTHLPSLAPQAFFWANGNIKYAGIEDLRIDAQYNDFAVTFTFCTYCWAKNIEVDHIARDGVFFMYSLHGEIRDSYFYLNQAGAPTNYGIELGNATACLVENNIFDSLTAAIMMGCSANGNVSAYNFIVNSSAGSQWLFPDISAHCSHGYMNLMESNIGSNVIFDIIHGSNSHETVFRNRLTGYKPAVPYGGGLWSNNNMPVILEGWNRFDNFVGNVLGTPVIQNGYEASNAPIETGVSATFPDGGSGGVGPIYVLGYYGGDTTNMTNYDPLTLGTLYRWGNFDYFTNAVHYDPKEIPSGAAVPSTQILPASLYLSGRPSWFGSLDWPAVGPEVTGGYDPSGHTKKIPAQICYENGIKLGLVFDGASCYGTSTPPTPSAPVIVTQPQDQTVPLGQAAIFRVIVSAYPVPTFQWQKNQADIAGATSATYTTPGATSPDDGSKYRCVVTNNLGSVQSNEAKLIIGSSSGSGGNGSNVTAFLPFKNIFNPAKDVLTIRFTLAPGDATLNVYDRHGNSIASLDRGNGISTTWDGRNKSGSVVASGTYLLILKQGSTVKKKKIVVLK